MRLDHKCPYCGRQNDRASGVTEAGKFDDGELNEGAIGLCFGCGEWMIWEAGAMRKPTDEELVEVAGNEVARKVREAWCLVRGPGQ